MQMAPTDPFSIADQALSVALDAVMAPLEFVYRAPWVAPFVLFIPMLLWAAWKILTAVRQTQPYIDAATSCAKAIRTALGPISEPDAERIAFSENFDQIVSSFAASKPKAPQLLQAWREFHETIVDERTSPIQNTSRPFPYFQRVEPRQTALIFWSNSFVGIGLVLTFVGLIVALRTAAHGMGGGASQAQSALTGLLTVSSGKFFTSVGGILASLLLRFYEAGLTRKTRAVTQEICELLERGLVYIPPQRLAAQQLEELKEQTAQLKNFNQDIAFQIADRINAGVTAGVAAAFSPVAVSIDKMTTDMAKVTDGIGQGVGEAITKVSGEQLHGLNDVLTRLGEKLDGISTAVAASGDDAARQIRDAGADFREAATEIRAAFDDLAKTVGELGGVIVDGAAEAAVAQTQASARMIASLEEAQKRSSGMLEKAVEALEQAAANAASRVEADVGSKFNEGARDVGEKFRAVLDASGQEMREASERLAKAIDEASQKVNQASVGFVSSGDAASRTATAMESIASESRTTARSIAESAQGFSAAAAPVVAAVKSINDASSQIARSIAEGRGSEERLLSELTALAAKIRDTQTAAETAWSDYRARFEGVDKALANSTAEMVDTLSASMNDFRKFAQSVDTELGKAIIKLSGSIAPMSEYADSLDKYVELHTPKS